MDMSFTQDPRYQNAVLKLSRLPDYEHSAISTAALDAGFAEQDMVKRLQLMQMAANDLRARRNLGLRTRGLKSRRIIDAGRMGLRKDVADEEQRQHNIGMVTSTIGAGANAYFGHRAKMASMRRADALEEHRLKTYGKGKKT